MFNKWKGIGFIYKSLIVVFLIGLFLGGLVGGCVAGKKEAYAKEDAIRAIVGEAANQGSQGMLAIACAIRNRGHLKGAYGLN